MQNFRIAMVQMNPTLGDLDGNARAICGWIQEAKNAQADVVVFPELAVTGYPPEDLLLKPRFLRDAGRMVDRIVKETKDIIAVVGCVTAGKPLEVARTGLPSSDTKSIYNAAVVMSGRKIIGTYEKQFLPNYGVFDERRYFSPGKRISVFAVRGILLGVNICEDIWFREGPTQVQAQSGGAHLILNINASPFQAGKSFVREKMLAARARDNRVMVSYTNMVGGQDELIFDGNSVIVDQKGKIIYRAKAFEEDLLVADLPLEALRKGRRDKRPLGQSLRNVRQKVHRAVIPTISLPASRRPIMPRHESILEPLEEVYRALVLGVRDYVKKNRFKKVLIGISGGIDSALTAVIARDAIGAHNVIGVLMPSPYTSAESLEDAKKLSRELQIELHTISIAKLFRSYLQLLKPTFKGMPQDTTEENLQARIRGNVLMAMSNKFGYLVLTTGNKSEMSVGYATLYGDMAGGFAVIKDVPKTLVFDLARWRSELKRSELGDVSIPRRIQKRAPSAELKANQTDQDFLPPYPILDAILKAYVEEDSSPEEIAKRGYSSKVVRNVVAMVDQSEYKRRQAPIGIKITPRALGKDHRMPITNRYPHL